MGGQIAQLAVVVDSCRVDKLQLVEVRIVVLVVVEIVVVVGKDFDWAVEIDCYKVPSAAARSDRELYQQQKLFL